MLFDFMEGAIFFLRDNSTSVDELTLVLLIEKSFLYRRPLAWADLFFMEIYIS